MGGARGALKAAALPVRSGHGPRRAPSPWTRARPVRQAAELRALAAPASTRPPAPPRRAPRSPGNLSSDNKRARRGHGRSRGPQPPRDPTRAARTKRLLTFRPRRAGHLLPSSSRGRPACSPPGKPARSASVRGRSPPLRRSGPAPAAAACLKAAPGVLLSCDAGPGPIPPPPRRPPQRAVYPPGSLQSVPHASCGGGGGGGRAFACSGVYAAVAANNAASHWPSSMTRPQRARVAAIGWATRKSIPPWAVGNAQSEAAEGAPSSAALRPAGRM